MAETGSTGSSLGLEKGETAPLNGSKLADVPHAHDSVRRSQWYHTCVVIMAEVIGAGVLGLPYATARLGLACGVMAALLFGAAALYSGLLLVRTKHDLGQHEANSYNDLGHALGGKTFGRMTGGVVLVTWAMMLPYFLLACADSITLVFPEWQLKTWQSALITFAILVLPLQLRTLHHISMLCLPSALAVVVAISIILASLFNAEHAETTAMGPDFNPWPDKQFTFFDFFGDIGAFVFAYSGHSMYLEMMREMVDSREFGTTALPVATLVMVICYTGTAVAGVCAYGSAVSDFLPNSMPEGPAKRCVGVLLAFHTLVSYLVTGQPLHRAIHTFLFPQTVDERTLRSSLDWMLITALQLVISVILALAIPFFAELQGLLGSLTCAPFIFGFPAFFFFRASSYSNVPVGWADYLLCGLFLFVLTPLFMIVGTSSELFDIFGKWEAEFKSG